MTKYLTVDRQEIEMKNEVDTRSGVDLKCGKEFVGWELSTRNPSEGGHH